MIAGAMLVVGPYKMVARVDGSLSIGADMPGAPPESITVLPEKQEDFLQFLALVVGLHELGNRTG